MGTKAKEKFEQEVRQGLTPFEIYQELHTKHLALMTLLHLAEEGEVRTKIEAQIKELEEVRVIAFYMMYKIEEQA